MVYLIAQISVYLGLACVIGVSVGWLIWGEMARRIKTEAAALRSKLTDLEARHRAAVAERADFEKKVLDREGEIAGLHKRVLEPAISAGELEDKMKAAVAEKDAVIAQLRDQQRVTSGLLEVRDEEIIKLQAQVSASEAHEQAFSARAREWDAMLADKDTLIAEFKSKLTELDARQQAVISELESKVQNLFTQHQALASGQEKLRNTVTEKESELARLQTRLAAAAASLAAASTQQQAANEEIARLRQIQSVFAQPLPHDEVTAMAHSYAAARNFQGGNPQEDWSRAENAVRLNMLHECLSRNNPVAASA